MSEKPIDDDQEDLNSISTVMRSASGRRFVMNILEDCKWNLPLFAQGHGDISFNVGVHSVGQSLFESIEKAQPRQAGMMLAEWRERRDREEIKANRESSNATGPTAPLTGD